MGVRSSGVGVRRCRSLEADRRIETPQLPVSLTRRLYRRQVGCVTTSRNSLRQGKLGVTPVTMDGEGDVMWITEIEQVSS